MSEQKQKKEELEKRIIEEATRLLEKQTEILDKMFLEEKKHE